MLICQSGKGLTLRVPLEVCDQFGGAVHEGALMDSVEGLITIHCPVLQCRNLLPLQIQTCTGKDESLLSPQVCTWALVCNCASDRSPDRVLTPEPPR